MYLLKQRELLDSQTHLIEIDLLRGGRHTVAPPRDRIADLAGAFDYVASVHRFDRLEEFEVYPVQLEERLPELAFPLLPGDLDVCVDLQAVFDHCYDAGPYRRRVRYGEGRDHPAAERRASGLGAHTRRRSREVSISSVNRHPRPGNRWPPRAGRAIGLAVIDPSGAKAMISTACRPGPEEMYRALVARDAGYDGLFVAAIRTTGIFCRANLPGAQAAVRERDLLRLQHPGPTRGVPPMQAVPARGVVPPRPGSATLMATVDRGAVPPVHRRRP